MFKMCRMKFVQDVREEEEIKQVLADERRKKSIDRVPPRKIYTGD